MSDTREGLSLPRDIRDQALEDLTRWLEAGGALALLKDECKRFTRWSYTHGWRIPLELGGSDAELKILVSNRFPWRAPDVYVSPRFYRVIPHVETDGFVCVFPSDYTVDPFNGVGQAKCALRRAHELLTRQRSDAELAAEFAGEFLSYWRGTANKRLNVRSLCTPGARVRLITIWRGQNFVLAADDEAQASRWLRHRRRAEKSNRPQDTYEAGLYIPLSQAPTPSQFPETAAALRELAAREGEEVLRLLEDEMAANGKPFVVICRAETVNGPAFFAIEVLRPTKQWRGPGKSVDLTTKGFRSGRVPQQLATKWMLGANSCLQGDVKRIDPMWVHGRDTVPSVDRLHQSRVLLIGCGSIGSGVAIHLASAGVGSITLVDPDRIETANVGRHVLGVDSLGHDKATSVADLLLNRFPHMVEARGIASSWENAYEKDPTLIASYSLIVVAVGDWRSEGPLNSALLRIPDRPPAVYGWTEPFAGAGHAVVVDRGSGCMACGLDIYGAPRLAVTYWPKEAKRQEPACGAMFQPYGPIELAHVNAIIARAAIDALTMTVPMDRRHRVWCALREEVVAAGGEWTPEWALKAENREAGGFLYSTAWTIDPQCHACKGMGG